MTLHKYLGPLSNHATPEEADKLIILIPELNVILLSLKKMKMTKARLLYELDKSENTGKRLKLKRLMDDIDLYHGKVTLKKRRIIGIVQRIKWRIENKNA